MSFSILMLNNINAVQQVVLIVIDLNLKILNDNMLININLLSWYHSAYWNWQFAEQHQFILIDVIQYIDNDNMLNNINLDKLMSFSTITITIYWITSIYLNWYHSAFLDLKWRELVNNHHQFSGWWVCKQFH